MTQDKEIELAMMKKEILDITMCEVSKLKKNDKYRKTQDQIRSTRKFLDQNDLSVVPSDKTNRLVLTKEADFEEKIFRILEDRETYKPLTESKQNAIEKQANKLIKNTLENKGFSKSDLQKLISTGGKPATFQAFVKDHKEKEEGFPLRPIASVRNTATEKVDWLVGKILSQLVQYVPANVKNTRDLLDNIKLIETDDFNLNFTFVSLDVVNLYPSIPIEFGITAVLEIAVKHWKEINNFKLSTDDLERCLKFICYNYEIQFKDKIYLQKKGCPMGAHFAPPFAILTMHKVENKALQILKDKYNFVPPLYKRFIDDILIGPLERNDFTFEILSAFNSVNPNIQFKLEVPRPNEGLNFLDITILVRQANIDYRWFTKECHSDNSLRRDSWVPSSVKRNFLTSSVRNVYDKCSNTELFNEAKKKLDIRFAKNGYKIQSHSLLKEQNKQPRKRVNKPVSTSLVLDFVSDQHSRKIRQILNKYNFPIRLVNKPARFLKQCFNKKNTFKHKPDCEICKRLDKFECKDRFLVYKFKCQICDNFYIGQTCRPFYIRFKEHKSSLSNNDTKSALSEHWSLAHANLNRNIDCFDLEILRQCKNSIETRLAEARLIGSQQPTLNRKHEIAPL